MAVWRRDRCAAFEDDAGGRRERHGGDGIAVFSTSFPVSGTESIIATYSGDSNYATSTATGVALTVNAGPSFTVVPTTTTYNLISGATTGTTFVTTWPLPTCSILQR